MAEGAELGATLWHAAQGSCRFNCFLWTHFISLMQSGIGRISLFESSPASSARLGLACVCVCVREPIQPAINTTHPAIINISRHRRHRGSSVNPFVAVCLRVHQMAKSV